MSLADRMREHHVSAVSVAVIDRGRIAWARGFGTTRPDGGALVTSHTVFQCGSLSKVASSFGALKLVDEGRLDADADVNTLLTSWKVPESEWTREDKVTVARVLLQRSGLAQPTPDYAVGYPRGSAVPSLLEVLEGKPPSVTSAVRVEAKPGHETHWSGAGWVVLEQAIDDVTRVPFPGVMRSVLLDPLGMEDSTFEQPLPAAYEGRFAFGEEPGGAPISGGYHVQPELAAVGLWCTPTDAARLILAMSAAARGDTTFLHGVAARTILRQGFQERALGWVPLEESSPLYVREGTHQYGYFGDAWLWMDGERGAVVFTNGHEDSGSPQLVLEILRAIAAEYGWPESDLGPERHALVVVPREVLAAVPGAYLLEPIQVDDQKVPAQTASVSIRDGRVLWLPEGGRERELLPDSPWRYFSREPAPTIEFDHDDAGVVTGVIVHLPGGQVRRGKKQF